MRELAKQMPGAIPEYKSGTIALHFRQVPHQAGPLLRSIEAMTARIRRNSLIQPGKMVYEIKSRGVDKGAAPSRK